LDVEAAALRALAGDFEQINWSLFREALRPAPLSLSDAETTLGCFRSDPRGIALSRALVLQRPWGEVQEVLKHEMAHQFVDEVLGVRDQTAHGPAFRRVCEERGIDPAASGAPSLARSAGQGNRGVIQRVQKLLALAGSPNPHEAETAMRTAHRLMLEHNVQHVGGEQSEYGYRHLGRATGRTTEAERALAGLLGEFFFVQPIWVSVFRVKDQKRVNILEITGRHENLAMAEYVHAFLLHSADALWKQHKRDHGITRDRDRQSYRAGVIRGFSDKLRAERTQQAGVGLVWVGDPQADRHFRRRHPRVHTVSRYSTERSEAAGHGRSAGRKLVLNRPLQTGTRARGRLLPPG
jgi:hypothetical protein